MNRKEKAAGMFADSFNCAQAVATSFSDLTGIDEDLSCRMACAFGAGGGRREFLCGAAAGSLLVISLLKGRGHGGVKQDQDEAYALARSYFSRFEGLHGSCECRKLIDGIDLLTEEGQARFRNEGMSAKCTGYITDSVAILEDILKVT